MLTIMALTIFKKTLQRHKIENPKTRPYKSQYFKLMVLTRRCYRYGGFAIEQIKKYIFIIILNIAQEHIKIMHKSKCTQN